MASSAGPSAPAFADLRADERIHRRPRRFAARPSEQKVGADGTPRRMAGPAPFPLAGVEVLDRYRYRIRIKGKYPQFVYWLAMPFFAPMPWEADKFHSQPGMAEKNLTLDWYPIGTGPYMLTENNPNARMVLERNPNFHGETYPCEGEAGDRAAGLLADCGQAAAIHRQGGVHPREGADSLLEQVSAGLLRCLRHLLRLLRSGGAGGQRRRGRR